MKVCLISAPTANDFDDPEIVESDAVRVTAQHAPLGILSLAAVLEENGLVPTIIDLNRLYYDHLRSEERREKGMDFAAYAGHHCENLSFDVWGFSTICSSYPLTLRIAREVKRAHPAAHVLLGGPQASAVDAQTLQSFPFVDCILRGEAERTLPMLMAAISEGQSYSDIPGLTFRQRDRIERNPGARIIQDLDALPFPAFHLYPHMQGSEIAPIELGRGCPFACTFCSTSDYFRRRFRLKSPNRILAEMKRVNESYGIKSFDLVHDLFTVDRKRVVAFCKALIESGDKFFWGCSARTDCIDDELIALMTRAGCRGIFFGIETGSARMQKTINKRLDLDEAASRIKSAAARKIKTAVSLITGFPDETMQDLRDTVGFFVDALRFDHTDPQLGLLAPLAGTVLYKQHQDRLIFDDVVSDMSFQGWQQDPVDRRMIADYPDIFPNFYSIPTAYLDRRFVKELRSFMLNGVSYFRWLLVGLHQDSGDLTEVFALWREWRETHKGPYPDNNSTHYYATRTFQADMVEFVRTYYLPQKGKAIVALTALTDYATPSDAGREKSKSASDGRDQEWPKDCGGLIGPELTPVMAKDTQVTKLGADYGKIVQVLRRKGRLDRVPSRPVTLVTRPTPQKTTDVIQASPASATLLALIDGKRTVQEIADQFSTIEGDVMGVPAATACMVGLELLRRQGLVVLTRAA